jgi:hypothetical protein
MSSEFFIWIVHVPMYLWEFSWNFGILFIYIDISGFIFAQENISKK